MALAIRFELNNNLFLRDPQDTDLGRKIIQYSILLIDELGLESFNFKKLAQKINSTEASIYRYFDNKHTLLVYLTSWYWEWVHYLIEINLMNISDPEQRLRITIENIVNASFENHAIAYVNENILHRIIVNESTKAYHTAKVDDENESGLFLSYKALVKKVADVILQINPNFPYPKSLASNLFEMANNQIFFAQHLPRLTDLKNKKTIYQDLQKMMEYFAFKLLSH